MNDASRRKRPRHHLDHKPTPAPAPPVSVVPAAVASSSSLSSSRDFFAAFISPVSADDFFAHFFERRPFAVRRRRRTVDVVTTNAPLSDMSKLTAQPIRRRSVRPAVCGVPATLTVDDIRRLIAAGHARYRRDLDVTAFRDGRRVTLTPAESMPLVSSDVWKQFADGASLRLLCPQQHVDGVADAMCRFDDVFAMQFGANAYLTPAQTSGFAPHYDDVDILIQQCAGSKRWRLFAPKDQTHILPTESSRNMTMTELSTCVLDVVLNAGDVLYAPRGTIHHCTAAHDADSLHVTFSTAQQHTIAEYVQRLLAARIRRAMSSDHVWRQTLPVGYGAYVGRQHTDTPSPLREEFISRVSALIRGVLTDVSGDAFDDAADSMAVTDLRGRVPPMTLRARKRGRSDVGVNGNTLVRLASASVCRISVVSDVDVADVADSETFFLYHSAMNALTFRGAPFQRLEIAVALKPVIRALMKTFPSPIPIKRLPKPEIDCEQRDSDGAAELSGADLLDVRHLMLELLKHNIIVVIDGAHEDEAARLHADRHEQVYRSIAVSQVQKVVASLPE